MLSRYQQLRQSIARLSHDADAQHAYLESILGHLTSSGDASSYGNDELALEFGDIYIASGDMRDRGEIRQKEVDAARPLDTMLKGWSGARDANFWKREALWSDPRWEQVRECARRVLAAFPDEERPGASMGD